jgi:hypothetical protein
VEQAEDASWDAKTLVLVHRGQKDALCDHFTYFISRKLKFIVQIKVVIQEGIAKCLSFSVRL